MGLILLTSADWTALLNRIDALTAAVGRLQTSMETTMTALDDAVAALTTQVSANTSAEQSAVTLIQNLADMIQSNANDPKAITDLAAKLKTSADALAAAVTANTPAAPPGP